jgi:dephospho-CoA kinase
VALVVMVGMPGSGKSTIARNLSLASNRVNWIRSRDIIGLLSGVSTTVQAQTSGLDFTTRSESQDFISQAIQQYQSKQINLFDSVRPRAHWEIFQERFGTNSILLSIDAPDKIRAERLRSRVEPEVIADRDSHPIEKDVPGLIEDAQLQINNIGRIRDACYILLSELSKTMPSDIELLRAIDETSKALSNHVFLD